MKLDELAQSVKERLAMDEHIKAHQDFLKRQGTGAPTSFQRALDAEIKAAEADLLRDLRAQTDRMLWGAGPTGLSSIIDSPKLTVASADQILKDFYLPALKKQLEQPLHYSYGRIKISKDVLAMNTNGTSEYSDMLRNVRGKGVNVIKQGDFWVAYRGDKVIPFNNDREALLFIASKGNGWRLKSAKWGQKIR